MKYGEMLTMIGKYESLDADIGRTEAMIGDLMQCKQSVSGGGCASIRLKRSFDSPYRVFKLSDAEIEFIIMKRRNKLMKLKEEKKALGMD